MVKRAIEIKPNAHFGREKYQLKAMEWIIHPPKLQKEYLPSILGVKFDVAEELDSVPKAKEAVAGLSGLIVLGDAWQSVDVFYALAKSLQGDEKSSPAYMARLRAAELIGNGRGSALPTAPSGKALKNLLVEEGSPRYLLQKRNIEILEKKFKDLRAEADEWHMERNKYMLKRLKFGRHPDTDKTFWNDWQEPAAPSLHVPSPQEKRARRQQYLNIGMAVFGVLFVGLWMLRIINKRRKAGN